VEVHVDYADSERVAELYRLGNVLERKPTNSGLNLRVRMPLAEARRVKMKKEILKTKKLRS